MTKLSVKIPFSGFYNSSHDALFDGYLEREQDYLFTEYEITAEQYIKLSELFISEINWKEVHKGYAKAYCSALVELIEDESRQYREDSTGKRFLSEPFNLQLEFETLESPREYNFSTDCIYAKIPLVQLESMLELIPLEDWKAFVKEKCTSYDGFISFYLSNYDEWEKDLEKWGEARLGMILEAYLLQILEDKDMNDKLSAYELMEHWETNGNLENLIYENASQEFIDFRNSFDK